MLIIIQYSLTDLRNFIEVDQKSLPFPSWPMPMENEFVRSMGRISRRKLGGINNWIGESTICIAKQAIKINKWFSFCNSKEYSIKLKFRRFYFDGYASGKLEIGFCILTKKKCFDLYQTIEDLLSLEVRIKTTTGIERKCSLGNMEKDLLTQHYFATTPMCSIKDNAREDYSKYIKCSSPAIFVEFNIMENVSINGYNKVIEIKESDSTLYFYNFHFTNKKIHVWSFENAQSILINTEFARDIRIVLSRIVSNRKTLVEVLKSIDKGYISPKPFSKESNLLQSYLLDNIKNILNKEISVQNIEIVSLVRSVEDQIVSGDNDALFERLKKTINVRPQILNKVKEYLEYGDLVKICNADKVDITFKNNQILVNDSHNLNINITEGNINQNVADSQNVSNDFNEAFPILIQKLESEILLMQSAINSEVSSQLQRNLDLLKTEIANPSPKRDVVKKKADSFKSFAKSLGDIGLPLLKIVGEIITFT